MVLGRARGSGGSGRSGTVELLEDRLLRVVVRLFGIKERHVLVPRVRGALVERLLSNLGSAREAHVAGLRMEAFHEAPALATAGKLLNVAGDARDEFEVEFGGALSRALSRVVAGKLGLT